jgi:polyisoprenoid-binding protein YceI
MSQVELSKSRTASTLERGTARVDVKAIVQGTRISCQQKPHLTIHCSYSECREQNEPVYSAKSQLVSKFLNKDTMMMNLCLLLVFAASSLSFGQQQVAWPSDKSAVAWQTEKRMFLVKTVEPTGINTDVQVEVVKTGEMQVIRATIPINKFNSGDETRDKDVVEILKGQIQPKLEFTSRSLSSLEYQDLKAGNLKDLSGVLKIGGQDFPVTFDITMSGEGATQLIDGSLNGTFTQFKIDPPSVAGGVVAKVQDKLKLHLHIHAKDVKGY